MVCKVPLSESPQSWHPSHYRWCVLLRASCSTPSGLGQKSTPTTRDPSHTMEIKEAESDIDIARCLPAVSELRTHFKENSSKFVERVQQQREKGYHLVYLKDHGSIQAIAGYRIRDNLETKSPRHMYVADLVSMPTERSKGYGNHIFSYLEDTARRAGCKRILLESNIERERAHKFYAKKGLTKTAYRFVKNL